MSNISATNIINLREFRENVQAYADKVEDGASFIVMKQSKPLFKIISPWESFDFTEDAQEYGGRRGIPMDKAIERMERSIKQDRVNG